MLAIVVPEISLVEYLLSKCTYKKVKDRNNIIIFKAVYNNSKFLILITGYGKVNIGSSLSFLINNFSIEKLVQIGTAGSLKEKIEIFDSVVSNSTLQYDVDFTLLGEKEVTLPNQQKGVFYSENDLKCSLQESSIGCGVKTHDALIITGDSFISNYNLALKLKKTFCADAVDCECADVAQIAYNNKIDFATIKIISNYAFDYGVNQYKMYDEEANLICQKVILRFLRGK
ncbi:MAG: 5'-methylthioadenosine/S-adenosylhomocysteine nucleosidase [Bacilli bacterium]